MSIIVRKASSTQEINDLLNLRFETLVKSGRNPHPLYHYTKKISDSFDVYMTTKHLIAYEDGSPVASCRLIEFNQSVNLIGLNFDFKEALDSIEGQSYFLDMLCFLGANWPNEILFREFLSFSALMLHAENASTLFFLCPESFIETIENFGVSRIGKIVSGPSQLKFIPCKFDILNFYELWRQRIQDQEILRFQQSFYKSFFLPGEILIMQGERGGSAYLVEEGEVEVLIETRDELKPIGIIPSGNLVGEMAMVTGEKRTASVMAKSPTICLAFDRTPFMKLLEESPQRVIDIFRLFSKRISSANQRLAAKEG